MSDKVMNLQDRVKPARLTVVSTGETYELDFSRESVVFAENRGFKPGDVTDFPVTKIPEFFWYAFRKNYKRMAKNQTDKILDEIGGIPPQLLDRLVQLYAQAGYSSLIAQPEEDGDEKNAAYTLEL